MSRNNFVQDFLESYTHVISESEIVHCLPEVFLALSPHGRVSYRVETELLFSVRMNLFHIKLRIKFIVILEKRGQVNF